LLRRQNMDESSDKNRGSGKMSKQQDFCRALGDGTMVVILTNGSHRYWKKNKEGVWECLGEKPLDPSHN